MLKYLIVQLDDISTSFCSYKNNKTERQLISLDNLKKAILFAMKENLMVQYIYPDYEIPSEYINVIESVDNSKIKSVNYYEDADVIVCNNVDGLINTNVSNETIFIWKTTKGKLFNEYKQINASTLSLRRISVIIEDIDDFKEEDFSAYKAVLAYLSDILFDMYKNGDTPQLNILTDRLSLTQMNNCNAGFESITISPDGQFYICPAFYLNGETPVGNLVNGLDIKNPRLYKIEYAPICRQCDSYQCRRCIYLNKKTTLEVNTPSHEQCVVSHLERNATKELLVKLRTLGDFFRGQEIKNIDYIDPFDVVRND